MGGLSALDTRGCACADKGGQAAHGTPCGQAAHGTPRILFSRKYRKSHSNWAGSRYASCGGHPTNRHANPAISLVKVPQDWPP